VTRLYAATGDGVVRLTRDERGWTAEPFLQGSGARCVACSGDVVIAGTPSGLQLSDDGGERWVDPELPASDVYSVAVGPDGALYAGIEPSRLFCSRDGGSGWQVLDALLELPSRPTWSFPPRPWTSHVRWIAPSPHDAGLLLAGIELGGLMRSEDGGVTWSDHRPGAQRDVHALAWHPRVPGRAYEAAGGGAAWSFDGGRSWRPADEGRDRHYTWALAVDPEDPDCWFVSASTGPLQAHSGRPAEACVYRWRGDGPWQPLDGGLGPPLDSMPYALAAREDGLFLGFADGRLCASGDRGERWTEVPLRGDRLAAILALA
jgi:photosystem II stability/assembly factor-like uncharacterized protein